VQTLNTAATVGYTCGSCEFINSSIIFNGSGENQCIGIDSHLISSVWCLAIVYCYTGEYWSHLC